MNRINKKILILLISVLSLISFTMGVKATVFDKNVPGLEYGNGGGGYGTGGTNWDATIRAVRIRVYSGQTVKSGYYSICNNQNNCYSSITAKLCETGGYSYNDAATLKNDTKCDTSLSKRSLIGAIIGTNLEKTFYWSDSTVANSSYLLKWLKDKSYSNLLKILEELGYTIPENNKEVNDYVIIEPVTVVSCSSKYVMGTITSLIGANVSYSLQMGTYNKAMGGDVLCNDTNVEWPHTTFRRVYNTIASVFISNDSYTSSDFNDIYYNNGKNKYFGYFKFNIKDLPPPTPQYGYLKIKKINSSGLTITDIPSGKNSKVTFEIFEGSNCTSKKEDITFDVKNGSSEKIKLKVGNYSIRESVAPYGYKLEKICYNVTISSANTSNNPLIKSIINKKITCQDDFESKKINGVVSMQDRITIYKNWLKKDKDLNALLNLNNKSADDACKHDSCQDIYTSGCLGVQRGPTLNFDEGNLSCYNLPMIGNESETAFCKTDYTFYSKIGNNGNIGTRYQFYGGTINFGKFKSGRMILNFNVSNRKLAEGTLTVTCYVSGSSSTSRLNYAKSLNFDYHDYIDEVCLTDDGNLCNTTTNYLVENNLTSSVSNTTIGTLAKHTTTLKYDYLLKPVYGKYGSGEVVQNSSNTRLLGYGIISKFGDYGEKKLKFQIPSLGISNTSCQYKTEPEIVECIGEACNSTSDNPGDPWELNLKFRQISKSNPFPGKSGNGRKVGSNWCDGNNCNNNNKIVQETITNRNDSYNSTGAGPKYIINLNAKTIEQIKKKYNGQAYDDFGENCNTSSGTCAIDFIKWMKTQRILKEG